MAGFQKFLLRGNVVDLAVAVVIGTAFGAVVSGFTKAFLDPLIAIVTPSDNLADASFKAAGSTWPYGLFISAIISFVIIAAVVYFFVVVPVQRLLERYKTEPDQSPTLSRDCPHCLSSVPMNATVCAFCTRDLLAVA